MITFIATFVVVGIAFLLFYDFSGKKVVLDSLYQFSQVAVDEPYDEKCETKPRKARRAAGLIQNPDGITNLHDNFLRGRQISGDKPFLGVRPIFNGLAGSFQWESYNKVYEHIKNFGSGLIHLGVHPKENIGLYSVNRPGWVIAEHSCYMYDLVTVPLYDTLGDEALEYIIQLTEMRFVVLTANKVDNLLSIRSKIPKLKTLIVMDYSHITSEQKEKATQVGMELISFDDVKKQGSKDVKERATTGPDSVATICFTSGTTGLPKGAIITHGNLLSFIAAYHALAAKNYQPEYNSDDSYLSFLPLAHIFERVVQATLCNVGGRIGFYQGDTLKLLDDVGELKPTIFVAVPRLFNRIYEKVNEMIRSTTGPKRILFEHAYTVKKLNLKKGTAVHKLWDAIVFKKIRARLGGRVRSIITGSAPISPDVMDFLRICFSCTVIEGYGQTESTGGTCVTHMHDLGSGHVGSPFPNCIIKLRDVPSMNYTSKDQPFPRGEICVKGPNVFKGYYKQPEKTREALSEDGWLYTGDIGTIDDQGRLRIIDRVKNIFKLAQGEYIAPDKLEIVYNKHPAVQQSFIYGDSLQSTLVAVIVPTETFPAWCKENGFEGTIQELIKNPELKKYVVKEMIEYGKKNGLKGFEVIKNVYFDLNPFSPENGLLSPTFKSKRHELYNHYKEEIKNMYAELS